MRRSTTVADTAVPNDVEGQRSWPFFRHYLTGVANDLRPLQNTFVGSLITVLFHAMPYQSQTQRCCGRAYEFDSNKQVRVDKDI
jgi:hypothetical protein